MPRAGDRFKRANIGKSDNTAEAEWAKITIRRNVLAEVGAEHASVFDAFAGEGRMHAAVWCEAARYVGCDTRFFTDDRPAFVADNRRVLRAIDLAAFNVFDLDSYGSPWEQAYIIARGASSGRVNASGWFSRKAPGWRRSSTRCRRRWRFLPERARISSGFHACSTTSSTARCGGSPR